MRGALHATAFKTACESPPVEARGVRSRARSNPVPQAVRSDHVGRADFDFSATAGLRQVSSGAFSACAARCTRWHSREHAKRGFRAWDEGEQRAHVGHRHAAQVQRGACGVCHVVRACVERSCMSVAVTRRRWTAMRIRSVGEGLRGVGLRCTTLRPATLSSQHTPLLHRHYN